MINSITTLFYVFQSFSPHSHWWLRKTLCLTAECVGAYRTQWHENKAFTCLFCLCCWCFQCHIQKNHYLNQNHKAFSVCLLRVLQIRVSHLNLILSQLIYVSGVRQKSNFNLSHVDIQFSQHYLLRRLFSSLCALGVPAYAFWSIGLYVLSFQYHSVLTTYSFVIHFEIWKCDASVFVLSQHCCGRLRYFVVPYEFQNCFSASVLNKGHLHFNRDCTKPVDLFGQYGCINIIKSSNP